LDDCSSALEFGAIDFSVLDFDSILCKVIDGMFQIDLPMSIQNSIPKHLQVPKPAGPTTGNPAPPFTPGTLSPNKKQCIDGNPSRNPARGTFEVNDNMFPDADTLVRGIDWAALPKISICLNYHVQENCHSLYE
jgi:hypothetical protein